MLEVSEFNVIYQFLIEFKIYMINHSLIEIPDILWKIFSCLLQHGQISLTWKNYINDMGIFEPSRNVQCFEKPESLCSNIYQKVFLNKLEVEVTFSLGRKLLQHTYLHERLGNQLRSIRHLKLFAATLHSNCSEWLF